MSLRRQVARRPRRMGPALVAAGLAGLLAACGVPADDPAAPTAPTTDASTTTEEPTMDEPIVSGTGPVDGSDQTRRPPPALPTEVPAGVEEREDVQAAVADLAERLGVEESAVSVAGYATVTWSDGSLGCPEPGRMYTQALVPGSQLVLAADGQSYSYHNARGEPFSYCANPVLPAQASPTT